MRADEAIQKLEETGSANDEIECKVVPEITSPSMIPQYIDPSFPADRLRLKFYSVAQKRLVNGSLSCMVADRQQRSE